MIILAKLTASIKPVSKYVTCRHTDRHHGIKYCMANDGILMYIQTLCSVFAFYDKVRESLHGAMTHRANNSGIVLFSLDFPSIVIFVWYSLAIIRCTPDTLWQRCIDKCILGTILRLHNQPKAWSTVGISVIIMMRDWKNMTRDWRIQY